MSMSAQCFHAGAEMAFRVGQSRAVNCAASLPVLAKKRRSGSPPPEVLGNVCSDPSDSTAIRRRRRSPARSDPAKPFTFVNSANEIRTVCRGSFRALSPHPTALDSVVSIGRLSPVRKGIFGKRDSRVLLPPNEGLESTQLTRACLVLQLGSAVLPKCVFLGSMGRF